MIQTTSIWFRKMMILVVVCMTISLTFSACNDTSILEKEVIRTKNQSYTYRDLMYTIYEVEYQCNLQDAMFGEDDFWAPDEAGKTGEMYAKEMVMDQFLNQTYMYEQARKEGMSLSKEEKDSIEQDAKTLLEGMQKKYIDQTGFTCEYLQQAMEKKYIGDQYYFQELLQIDVDVEGLKAKLNYDDYRQYEVEYLFAPRYLYNEDGESVMLSEEEYQQSLKKLENALKEIKFGQQMQEVAEGYGDFSYELTGVPYFEQDGFEKEFVEAIQQLDNQELCDTIIQTEAGAYIVKMIDKDSSDAFDEAVDVMVEEEKNRILQERIDSWKTDNQVSINEENWKKITIRNYTCPVITEEEHETLLEGEDQEENN